MAAILNRELLQMAEEWALYLGFGSLAGILSGMFGIGGGVVIVPFLVWRFDREGFPAESIMVMAVATSLATILLTSVSAVYAHHRRGAVDWAAVGGMAPGILAGAVAGSLIADVLPVPWFKLIFGAFLLYVAGRLAWESRSVSAHALSPGRRLLAGAGLAIGAVSAILGIGGGTLSVPFLVRCRYSIRQAVAISSACGFPIALAGTAAYIALGQGRAGLPAGSLGYVYLPAFAGIIPTSIAFAPVGAHLAHGLPSPRLRRLFALVVLALGCKLFWQALNDGADLFSWQ
jgi:uncharacterized membrane protein YfcA